MSLNPSAFQSMKPEEFSSDLSQQVVCVLPPSRLSCETISYLCSPRTIYALALLRTLNMSTLDFEINRKYFKVSRTNKK